MCDKSKTKQFESWVGSDIGRISYTLRSFSKNKISEQVITPNWNVLTEANLSLHQYNQLFFKKELDHISWNHKRRNNKYEIQSSEILLSKTKGKELPEILFNSPKVNISIRIVEIYKDYFPVFVFDFPCNDKTDGASCCELEWIPLEVDCKTDVLKYCGYHDIFVTGRMVTQPRHTACFGSDYKFSGVTHSVEETIPNSIIKLMDLVNDNYGLSFSSKINMCLVNHYPTGRHCIGEHSDNEKEMLNLKNVFCFCEGDTRELIVRKVGKSTKKERQILRIKIPQGLYVMSGKEFQKHYTHEFPELYPYLFKQLQQKMDNLTEQFPNYPRNSIKSENGAERLHLEQALYMKKYSNDIKKYL